MRTTSLPYLAALLALLAAAPALLPACDDDDDGWMRDELVGADSDVADVAETDTPVVLDTVDQELAETEPYDFVTEHDISAEWPSSPGDYVPTNPLLVVRLEIPEFKSCCRDWGRYSDDFIYDATDDMDNGVAEAALLASTFGISMQDYTNLYLHDGNDLWILDHPALSLDGGPFLLAGMTGSFAAGTDWDAAARGQGTLAVNASSFAAGSGEPARLLRAELDAGPPMSLLTEAGPFMLPLSVFSALLWVPAYDVQVVAQPFLTDGVVTYSGEISGFVLVDDFLESMNAMLRSDRCACLGAERTQFEIVGDELIGDCIDRDDARSLCDEPLEAVCATLAGGVPWYDAPCTTLPGMYVALADLDLDGSCSADHCDFEGISAGYRFSTAPVTLQMP